MLFAWVILSVVAVAAVRRFNYTVIIWMACRLLFNAQVALKYSSPAMSLDFGVAVLLLGFYMLRIGGKRRLREPYYLAPILFATLLSYALSSAFSIAFVDEGLRILIKILVLNFASIYLLQKVLTTQRDIRMFITAFAIVSFIIVGLGIFESVFKDNPYLDYVYYNSPQEGTEGRMYYLPPGVGSTFHIRYGLVRAYSTFGIHISFGSACVFILGFLLIMRDQKWLKANEWLIKAATILLVIGAIISNSKTCYVGLFIMLLLVVNPKRLLNFKTVLGFFIAVIAVIVLYNYFPGYFNNVLSLFDGDLADEGGGSTVAVRERQLEVALHMFSEKPLFGYGPGTLNVLKSVGNNSDILGAEGAHLSILPERGFVGYMVYLATFAYFYMTMKKIMPPYKIFIFLLALFIMEIVSGLRDMTLYWSLLIAIRRTYLLKATYLELYGNNWNTRLWSREIY